MPEYCEHSPDSWDVCDDGCEYCEECDAAICPECRAIFEEDGYGMDTGESHYSPPCSCAHADHFAHP